MANVITIIPTDAGREALAKSFGGPSGSFLWSYGKYFKIGTAMHTDVSGQDHPLPPQSNFTDIQSIVSGVFWYKKTYIPSDSLFVSPATIQFRSFLDLTEANGDSGAEPDTGATLDGPKNSSSLSGSAPIFFELGLFDAQDVMIGYGTFPGETKLLSKTLNHLVNVNF